MIVLSEISKSFKNRNEKKVNQYLFAALYKSIFKNKTNKTPVLNNINLNIPQGERVAIIGRNKSGKTTLMHIIANISRPDKGKLQIRGKVVPVFGLGVGFSTILTGTENLILNATSLGASYHWVKANTSAIQEFSEIENLNMPLKFFSNGMKARLALSIAVFVYADILILDEVLDGVDIFFKKKALDRIVENAKKNNTTLLVVSHDEEVLKMLCTSVIYLKNGIIAETGNMDVMEKYKNELN